MVHDVYSVYSFSCGLPPFPLSSFLPSFSLACTEDLLSYLFLFLPLPLSMLVYNFFLFLLFSIYASRLVFSFFSIVFLVFCFFSLFLIFLSFIFNVHGVFFFLSTSYSFLLSVYLLLHSFLNFILSYTFLLIYLPPSPNFHGGDFLGVEEKSIDFLFRFNEIHFTGAGTAVGRAFSLIFIFNHYFSCSELIKVIRDGKSDDLL